MRFEWDEAKNRINIAKHGLDFADVARFDFDTALLDIDDREDYGEERFILIGMAGQRLLVVAYTMRDERMRLISARGAEPFEQRQYHEQYS